jgi:hypothetical protein
MCKSGFILNSMLHISLVAVGCKACTMILYDTIETTKKNNETNKTNYDYTKLLGPF